MNIYIYLNMYRGRPDVQIKCKFFLCFIEKCIFFFLLWFAIYWLFLSY